MKRFLITSAIALGFGTLLTAQAQPPAQPPAQPAAKPPAAAKPAQTRPANRSARSAAPALAVTVTDQSGNGIDEVNVDVSGPVDRSGRTAADGTISFRTMRAGTYRLRFEHERYITLEREVVVGTRASEVMVALNPAPVEKPVVAAAPPAAPPPVQKPTNRAVEPRTLSIPDFFEANAIGGSEPQKSSLLGCTDGGTAKLFQMKEPITNQVNEDADQVVYVVGGNATFRVRDRDFTTPSGSFLLIPRGATYSARRVGRNPLVALVVAMGTPCTDPGALAR